MLIFLPGISKNVKQRRITNFRYGILFDKILQKAIILNVLNTLMDIYHQPEGFQENILTISSTFPKQSIKKNNTLFECTDKEL